MHSCRFGNVLARFLGSCALVVTAVSRAAGLTAEAGTGVATQISQALAGPGAAQNVPVFQALERERIRFAKAPLCIRGVAVGVTVQGGAVQSARVIGCIVRGCICIQRASSSRRGSDGSMFRVQRHDLQRRWRPLWRVCGRPGW